MNISREWDGNFRVLILYDLGLLHLEGARSEQEGPRSPQGPITMTTWIRGEAGLRGAS